MHRLDFVDTARSYIDTPFAHQARVPGVSLDCAGVLVCAARENGYAVDDMLGYSRLPGNGLFTKMILNHCYSINLSEALAGDILLFKWRSEPQHSAIISNINPLTIIHSYAEAGKVTENNVGEEWLSRLCGCYRLKNIQ